MGFYSETFAGVDEVENRDILTNDQLNEQANETPNLLIFVKCFGGTFVGPFSDLVRLFLDLVALDLVGPLQVAALNSIQQDCL